MNLVPYVATIIPIYTPGRWGSRPTPSQLRHHLARASSARSRMMLETILLIICIIALGIIVILDLKEPQPRDPHSLLTEYLQSKARHPSMRNRKNPDLGDDE